MKYFDAIKETMKWLGEKPDTVFIGQTVGCPGTFMYPTLADVPISKRLEFPVNESFQMQFCLGVALAGKVTIAVYPRQNFLLLATGDMVNMVDKIKAISENKLHPHLIIRVATGPQSPVHPGHQHIGTYFTAFSLMFKNIIVMGVNTPEEVQAKYEHAYNTPGQYLIIEDGNLYGQK